MMLIARPAQKRYFNKSLRRWNWKYYL